MITRDAYAEVRARQRRWLVGSLLVADALALALALVTAGALRLFIDTVLPVATLGLPDRHIIASVIAVPLLLVLLWLLGHYDVDNCLVGTRDYAITVHGVTYGVVIALGVSYFSGSEPLVSRSWLLLVWASSIVLVGAERFAARRVVRCLRRRGLLHTRVVIVGASNAGVALAGQLRESTGEGLDVVGFLDEYLPLGDELLPGVPVIGRPQELAQAKRPQLGDEYIFLPQALPYERLEELTHLIVQRDGPVLRMAVTSRDLLTHGLLVSERGHVPLVTLRRASISGVDAVLKRSLDIVGATLALVVVGPLTLAALAWAYVSGVQRLIVWELIQGPGGGRARLWLVAEDVTSRLAIRGAPALIGVLSGSLSLVGPRPIACEPSADPAYAPLWVTALRPGLTGPWRLSGPHASIDDQMLQDLTYVRNYTIWEDLRILWRSAQPRALLARWHAANSVPKRRAATAPAQPHA